MSAWKWMWKLMLPLLTISSPSGAQRGSYYIAIWGKLTAMNLVAIQNGRPGSSTKTGFCIILLGILSKDLIHLGILSLGDVAKMLHTLFSSAPNTPPQCWSCKHLFMCLSLRISLNEQKRTQQRIKRMLHQKGADHVWCWPPSAKVSLTSMEIEGTWHLLGQSGAIHDKKNGILKMQNATFVILAVGGWLMALSKMKQS